MKINKVYEVEVQGADFEFEIKFESRLLEITEIDDETVLEFANGVKLTHSCTARVILGELNEDVSSE